MFRSPCTVSFDTEKSSVVCIYGGFILFNLNFTDITMIYHFEFSHMGSMHFFYNISEPPPRTKSDSYTAKLHMQRGISLFILVYQISSLLGQMFLRPVVKHKEKRWSIFQNINPYLDHLWQHPSTIL